MKSTKEKGGSRIPHQAEYPSDAGGENPLYALPHGVFDKVADLVVLFFRLALAPDESYSNRQNEDWPNEAKHHGDGPVDGVLDAEELLHHERDAEADGEAHEEDEGRESPRKFLLGWLFLV